MWFFKYFAEIGIPTTGAFLTSIDLYLRTQFEVAFVVDRTVCMSLMYMYVAHLLHYPFISAYCDVCLHT